MAKNPTPKLDDLQKHADRIRSDLAVPKQSELFKLAVEAGYLAALADGTADEIERQMIAKSVEILSTGGVIEWEVETLVDECAARVDKEGEKARIEAVGNALGALGQPEAGLLIAGFVAQASGGVSKKESKVLEAIGKAAGLPADKVSAALKRAAIG